jgi:hypothetical protein
MPPELAALAFCTSTEIVLTPITKPEVRDTVEEVP